jgi:predicted DNA-binding transcriptional regulator AlpA
MQRIPDTPTTQIDMPLTGLRERQAARYIGLTERGLRELRLKARGQAVAQAPRHYKIGRLVRYRKCDLDQWIMERLSVA